MPISSPSPTDRSELRQQLGPHEDAEACEQRVVEALAAGELQLAVVREARLDGAQLHHPRAAAVLLGAAHHRRRLRPTRWLAAPRRAQALVDRCGELAASNGRLLVMIGVGA